MCVLCAQRSLANGQFSGHVEMNFATLTPTLTPTTPTGTSTTTAAVATLLETFNWNGTIGTAAMVPYSFGLSFEGGTLFNATERTAALSAMQQWANVANINFQSVTNSSAKLAFSKTTFGPDLAGLTTTFFSGTRIAQSEVQIDSTVTSFGNGTFGHLVMLHEIGHALGLKHPGAYGPSDTGPYLTSAEDTIQNTVMSYNDSALVNASNYPVTPMIYDIAAMQYLYGANMAFNAGDSNYTFNGSTTAQTLWDGGGFDTIQVAGFTGNTTIDLNSGINNATSIGGARIWIAFNANIENAIGNNGNDRITGNALGNHLYGSGGLDTINGGAGNDLIFGGNGVTDPTDASDLIFGGSGVDEIYGNGGNDTIYGGASETDGSDAADLVYGGLGVDFIAGNAGNDTIYGGGSTTDPFDQGDTIFGGLGNDLIYGNGGGDQIFGSVGNDTMHGGLGDDQYRISSGEGQDLILFFEGAGVAGGDVIVLSSNINGIGVGSGAGMIPQISYGSGNALINLGGGNNLTVFGVTSFTADDFAFV